MSWSRTRALTVECPYCHAAIGKPCMGKRRPRISVHRERLLAANQKEPRKFSEKLA